MASNREQIGMDVIAHLTLITLIGYSAYFWYERVIYVDSALQFFEWVQFDRLIPQQGYRWPAMVPQVVVKVFRWAGSDLRTMAIAASVAYAAWQYVVFLFTRYFLRSRVASVAMALAAVLFARHSFYEMVLETQLLAFYPLALLGWFEDGRRRGGPVMGMLLLSVCLTVHPVGLVAALAMISLGWLEYGAARRDLFLFAGITVSWLLVRYLALPVSGYEAGMYASIKEGLAAPFRWTEYPQVVNFIDHAGRLSWVYVPGIIIGLFTCVLFIRSRRWMVLGSFLLVAVGYFALIALTYHKGESALMIEKNLIFLGAWFAGTFLIACKGADLRPKAAWGGAILMLGVVAFKVRDISLAGRVYEQRAHLVDGLVANAAGQGSKFVVDDDLLAARGYWIPWALPFESLLSSALSGERPNVTLLPASLGVEPSSYGVFDVALPPTERRFDQRQLQERYFQLEEGSYRDLAP